jgi:hypothetical protein
MRPERKVYDPEAVAFESRAALSDIAERAQEIVPMKRLARFDGYISYRIRKWIGSFLHVA